MRDQATRLIAGVILFVKKLVNESTVDKKSCWGDRVKVFWQNNAWVDSLVMRDLARRFYEHKVAVHGEDVWVILFCALRLSQKRITNTSSPWTATLCS